MEHSSEHGPRPDGNVGDLGRLMGEFGFVPAWNRWGVHSEFVAAAGSVKNFIFLNVTEDDRGALAALFFP